MQLATEVPITDVLTSQYLPGVNYGNRFVPEDWMQSESLNVFGDKYGPKVVQPKDISRVSLCDVADERMLKYLDDTIKEEDFKKMGHWGVQLIRVPTGYWNWVDLKDKTPNAEKPLADRFHNLQKIKPDAYKPYFDKIYKYAEKYGIKVMLQLHGAPGSQNGENHSGCVTDKEVKGGKPEHWFSTPYNQNVAVLTVEAMAKSCKEAGATCWGVGVLNKNQPNPGEKREDEHKFIDRYYDRAIKGARKHLDKSVPVSLFSWSYDFDLWASDRFADFETYGNVKWETHLYTEAFDTVEQVVDATVKELGPMQAFQNRTKQDVLISEYSLSNFKGSPTDKAAWQSLSDEVAYKMRQVISGGALMWNFDARDDKWSMDTITADFGVNWNL